MLSGRNIFVALSDGDGSIYNPVWEMLMTHVAAKYHDFIFEYGKRPGLVTADNEGVVRSKLADITAEINSFANYEAGKPFDLRMPSYAELSNSLLEALGYPPLAKMDAETAHSTLTEIKITYRNFFNNFGECGREFLESVVHAANKPYFVEVTQRLKREKFDEFIQACGSNRQSQSVDFGNGEENYTGSFFATLEGLKEKFKQYFAENQLTIPVSLEKFLLADIYGELKPGESFQLALRELTHQLVSEEDSGLPHSEYVFDKTKFSLLYAMLHHFSKQFPNDHITIAFIDDLEEILEPLGRVFKAHPDLIPKNIRLEGWHYEGNHSVFAAEKLRFSVQGTAEKADEFYFESVLKIAIHSGWDDEHKPSIDAAKEMDFDAFKLDRVTQKLAGVVLDEAPGESASTAAKKDDVVRSVPGETAVFGAAPALTLFGGAQAANTQSNSLGAASAAVTAQKVEGPPF